MAQETGRRVHLLELAGRTQVAERTVELRFERPAGFTFKAGQYLDLVLRNPSQTDAEGVRRTFSICSAPDDAGLSFATRLRDTAFKRVVEAMPLGAVVEAEGPHGSFTLHGDAGRPAVFLAGGIGVTPFRSMVRRAVHERLPHRMVLLYSNRRPEDAPYLDELRGLAQENPRFTFVPTMTRMSGSRLAWRGETARLDHALVLKHLPDGSAWASGPSRPVYYLAGPPVMVQDLLEMLGRAGVDDGDVRAEEFSGY